MMRESPTVDSGRDAHGQPKWVKGNMWEVPTRPYRESLDRPMTLREFGREMEALDEDREYQATRLGLINLLQILAIAALALSVFFFHS